MSQQTKDPEAALDLILERARSRCQESGPPDASTGPAPSVSKFFVTEDEVSFLLAWYYYENFNGDAQFLEDLSSLPGSLHPIPADLRSKYHGSDRIIRRLMEPLEEFGRKWHLPPARCVRDLSFSLRRKDSPIRLQPEPPVHADDLYAGGIGIAFLEAPDITYKPRQGRQAYWDRYNEWDRANRQHIVAQMEEQDALLETGEAFSDLDLELELVLKAMDIELQPVRYRFLPYRDIEELRQGGKRLYLWAVKKCSWGDTHRKAPGKSKDRGSAEDQVRNWAKELGIVLPAS